MNMTTPEYDPETCVTAAELRERGMSIPDHIPDVAWIPEGSWTFTGDVSVQQDKDDPELLHVNLGSLVFTQPFRWIKGTYYTIPVKDPEEK